MPDSSNALYDHWQMFQILHDLGVAFLDNHGERIDIEAKLSEARGAEEAEREERLKNLGAEMAGGGRWQSALSVAERNEERFVKYCEGLEKEQVVAIIDAEEAGRARFIRLRDELRRVRASSRLHFSGLPDEAKEKSSATPVSLKEGDIFTQPKRVEITSEKIDAVFDAWMEGRVRLAREAKKNSPAPEDVAAATELLQKGLDSYAASVARLDRRLDAVQESIAAAGSDMARGRFKDGPMSATPGETQEPPATDGTASQADPALIEVAKVLGLDIERPAIQERVIAEVKRLRVLIDGLFGHMHPKDGDLRFVGIKGKKVTLRCDSEEATAAVAALLNRNLCLFDAYAFKSDMKKQGYSRP